MRRRGDRQRFALPDLYGRGLSKVNTKEGIYKAYDDAADDYASAFWNEIEAKNLDCIILK
jgi:hypothetical protein